MEGKDEIAGVKPMRRLNRFGIPIVLLIGHIISACADKPVVKRSFSTETLLVASSAMPVGWNVIESGKIDKEETEFSTDDAARVSFSFFKEPNKPVKQYVVRYKNPQSAQSVYEEMILPGQHGDPPIGWNYASSVADQSYFSCYDYNGQTDYPICEWSGRYSEYLVLLSAWEIPEQMSLQDIRNIVSTIDSTMAQYISQPLSNEVTN